MSFADALRVHELEHKVAVLEDEVVALRRLVAALTSPQRLDPVHVPPPAGLLQRTAEAGDPLVEVMKQGAREQIAAAQASRLPVDPEPPKNAPNGEYQKWLARRDARRGARSNAT